MGRWLKRDCLQLLRSLNGVIDKSGTKIRFIKKSSIDYFNGTRKIDYGYFKIKDSKIVECEYGYSGTYKGCIVLNIEKCWEENEEFRMRNLFTGELC
jgi:hypothetical protein